jgi:hypothetical protein
LIRLASRLIEQENAKAAKVSQKPQKETQGLFCGFGAAFAAFAL